MLLILRNGRVADLYFIDTARLLCLSSPPSRVQLPTYMGELLGAAKKKEPSPLENFTGSAGVVD